MTIGSHSLKDYLHWGSFNYIEFE